MVTVHIPQQQKTFDLNRILGCYPEGKQDGPLFLAIAGLHGNEPSGVFAVRNIIHKLRESDIPTQGKFVGLAGNLPALGKNLRFIDEDLNRLFLNEKIKAMKTSAELTNEEKELNQVICATEELAKYHNEVFFIDCHTTSSPTVPYISVNKYPESLSLAEKYPLFSVIGLEKSIPGCLAEYYNQQGFHGFTFEAGQHHSLTSIENHEAAIWLFLVYSGFISRSDFGNYSHYHNLLKERVDEKRDDFEVVEHYKIKPNEQFRMKPGYVNFQKVSKGDVLATNQKRVIRSDHDGRILMPLYQPQGDDGYFVLKKHT